MRKVFTPNPKATVKVGSEGVVYKIELRPKGSPLRGGAVLSEDNDILVSYGGMVYSEVSRYIEPILPEGAQPLGYSFEQMMSEFGVTEAVK